jgi:HlyD family secretion protein
MMTMSNPASKDLHTSSVRPIGVMRGTEGQDRPVERPSGWGRRRWLLGGGVGAVLLVIAALWPTLRDFFSAERTVPVSTLRFATVTRGRFVSDVSAQGTIVAALSPTLTAVAPGTVTFRVRAGENVKKNQLLAQIDSPELKNELAREQASLDGLEATLQREYFDLRRKVLENTKNRNAADLALRAAQREVDRVEAAWEKQVIPRRDVDKAHDELEAARLTQQQTEASDGLAHESLNLDLRMRRLDRDRQRLLVNDLKRKFDELSVRSPVDGVVGTLAVQERGAVAANAPVVTVVDLSVFEVEFAAPDVYAGALRTGLPAEVFVGAQPVAASVAAVSPEVRQGQVIGRLRFAGGMPPDIRQNQRVSLRMILDSRDGVLKVERGAFIDSGGGRVAYVVRDGRAVRTPITVGASSVSEVEILSGLSDGEQIVVSSLDPFQGAALARLVK